MCGIVGFAAAVRAAPPSPEALERAVAALRHRGPDGSGTHLDGRVALGHTRLSIIDVEGGAQPLGSEDGSVQTVFNGEIWNHELLRHELEAAGHRFRTRCDTEVLVHGWEQWGEELLTRLEGMFAFAIWDGRTDRLVLARDRVGKKPLYLSATDEGLAFGSDARAVAIVAGRTPAVDPEEVTAHLFQRYTVSPRTLFRDIERLEPGHLLVYDGVAADRRPYWQLDPATAESLAPADLRQLLREAVRARLMSDVPIGILLSGGLDSTAVLGLAREAGVKHVDTFTIGFADAVYDERSLARLAAERHGSNHHEIVVDTRSFVDALPRLAWFRDEPIAEPSEIPLLLLAEFAATRVKVALGGDGGDELFGGYPKYRAERLLRLGRVVPPRLLGRGVALASRRRTHRRLGRAAESLSITDETLRWGSWFRSFSPAEIAGLAAPAIADSASPARLLEPLRTALEPYAGLDPGRRMLVGDFLTYLPDNMLLRTDKVLMAASLEGRVPLLDRALVERVSRVPADERFGWRTGKTLFRAAVEDLLPPELLGAPKRGFPVPVARLLTGDDSRLLERLLLSERSLDRGLLRPDAVRALVHGDTVVSERELKLFTLATLELWFRASVDRVTPEPPATLSDLLHDEPR
jgi:asparagine synthase (glutamine-hydrolysing)